MTLTRQLWALSALALTLVLGACSTPDDLTAPTLEPQFGTNDNDFGADVAYASTGRVYVLSEQNGYYYDDEGSYIVYDNINLDRYDSNGNFVWSEVVSSSYCNTDYEYDCGGTKANTLVADSRGYSYALTTYSNVIGDCAVSNWHSVTKYDASGNSIRSVSVGNSGGDLGASYGANPVDLAVDGSGNLYVVKQEADLEDQCYNGSTNVVAKYSATGALQWQRTSPVGTLYGVTVSSSGSVYVAGSGGVAKYTNAGNQSWKISGDTRDIAAVGTNTVYARNLTTVRKLDANGKQLWSRAQAGLSGIVIGDMTTDSSANVYLTGKYNASSSNRDVFTRKLSASSGSTVFTKTFGTSAYDDARGVATINGSEIYITGATQGSLAHPFRGGENDGYVRKISSGGNPVWTR